MSSMNSPIASTYATATVTSFQRKAIARASSGSWKPFTGTPVSYPAIQKASKRPLAFTSTNGSDASHSWSPFTSVQSVSAPTRLGLNDALAAPT
jgi:hypothetical protein